jgi:hypothetical protein
VPRFAVRAQRADRNIVQVLSAVRTGHHRSLSLQALVGNRERSAMSETWTSLLSGVVGAIVGGAASLAGTMLVNRMQVAANARMRMYDELLPKLQQALSEYMVFTGFTTDFKRDLKVKEVNKDAAQRVDEALAALRRVSGLTGRQEQQQVAKLGPIWRELQGTARYAVPSDSSEPQKVSEAAQACFRMHSDLDDVMQELSTYLETKLG